MSGSFTDSFDCEGSLGGRDGTGVGCDGGSRAGISEVRHFVAFEVALAGDGAEEVGDGCIGLWWL